MSVDFAEIHDELRSVARELLGTASPLVGDGGPPPPANWAQLAEMGWLGLEVPEALGGAGATFAEVAVILEELGLAATVSPFLGTVVLGVGVLLLLEATAARDALLGKVATGAVHLAAVLTDGAMDGGPVAPFTLHDIPGGYRLHGGAELVIDVPDADLLLLLAATPAGTSVIVAVARDAPELTVSAQPLVDATRSAGAVSSAGMFVSADAVMHFAGDPQAAVGRVLDRGAVAIACDSQGVSRAMLDATVAYAGVRGQFGRPIGSFQAVKHACADMLVRITVSDELLRMALDALIADDPQASAAASMAKASVCEGAVEVTGKAMQLHGGIGYAWESGVHVYLKRATLDRALLGSPAEHRRRLGERLQQRVRTDGPGRV